MSQKKHVKEIGFAVNPKEQKQVAVWFVPVMTAVFFLFAAFVYGGLGKQLAILSCVGMILLLFMKKYYLNLTQRISLPLLALAGYLLVCGVSTFYALSGKFAIREYVKLLTAFGVYLAIVAGGTPEESSTRRIASILAGGMSVFSVISIDGGVSGWISKAFLWFMDLFTMEYGAGPGFEAGTRITGAFGNPNTYAGLTALTIFLCLYLSLSEENKRKRSYYVALLSINSLGFLLAFSMGGIAVFAVAAIVYLIALGKGKRTPAVVLMIETVLITLIMTFVAFAGLGKTGFLAALPLLAMGSGAVLLVLSDRLMGVRISGFLDRHARLSAVLAGGAILLLLTYVVLGVTLTGAYPLKSGGELRRSAYPSGGEYTFSAQANGDVRVRIESQNSAQTQMHTSTVLYNGSAENASFTVPEDSKVTYFYFKGADGTVLETATLTGDGKTEKLNLKYYLFPEFIANRLQGLWANENAIQRFVFFNDGMKVFARSPVIGSGLGGFENAVYGVQDFYYQTRYVHNHYIQSLAETGVIGLIFFAGVLLLSGFCLFRGRKAGKPCFPALCACLVMMAGHAAVEVVFSNAAYLVMAFGVLGLIALNFGIPLRVKYLGQSVRYGLAALCGVFALLICGNLFAKVVIRDNTFASLETAMTLDLFETNDYKLQYVKSSVQAQDNDEISKKGAEYALELAEVKSNSIPIELAKYYFAVGKPDQAFSAAERGLDYVKSFASAWQQQFVNFETAYSYEGGSLEKLLEDSEKYTARTLSFYEKLLSQNQVHMERIQLTPRNCAFIQRMMVLAEKTAPARSDDEVFNILYGLLFDSSYQVDLNADQINDMLTVTAGSLVPTENGGFKASAGTVLQLDSHYYYEGNYRLTIQCDTPEAITEVSVFEQPVQMERTADGLTAVISLPENTFSVSLPVKIHFSGESEVESLTFMIDAAS